MRAHNQTLKIVADLYSYVKFIHIWAKQKYIK